MLWNILCLILLQFSSPFLWLVLVWYVFSLFWFLLAAYNYILLFNQILQCILFSMLHDLNVMQLLICFLCVPSILFFKIYFMYFWLCWVFVSVSTFSSCGKRGPLFITVRGPLTIVASLVAEHRLQTRRLSSCGSQA